MKRVLLFAATNLAVLLVLSVVARLLGVDAWLALHGSGLGPLLGFAALFGCGGALVSLALSRFLAKRALGVRVIGQPANATEAWLLDTVRVLAGRVGVRMPEVGVFESPDPNAFATGARRDAALVAVSTGLLAQLDRREVEAVLGHELSHVANGDMVTLTLLQGVLNTFVIFVSRLIGALLDRTLLRNDGQGMGYVASVLVSQFLLGILASLIVAVFSRSREFRADGGGARVTAPAAMIAALERLQSAQEPAALPARLQAFGISGGAGSPLLRLFMSHPSLDARIAALRQLPPG